MDGFSSYNQIEIILIDQHKMEFICLRRTFSYRKFPFGLKNVGATFQHAMSYAFHDIKHIMDLYLDDLPAHSQQWEDHPGHLREIFLRCRHYNIQLNPHKCVFCVETRHLLGFVVSKYGIRIDPLKIAVVLALPTLTNITKLQSLQGKQNFIRHFICNFAKNTHGYTCLLKKDTLFFWDDQAQQAFDNLKHTLTHSPMLQPPDYSK